MVHQLMKQVTAVFLFEVTLPRFAMTMIRKVQLIPRVKVNELGNQLTFKLAVVNLYYWRSTYLSFEALLQQKGRNRLEMRPFPSTCRLSYSIALHQ